MLSKYVLCEKKKWCIEMFDKWEALMTFTIQDMKFLICEQKKTTFIDLTLGLTREQTK